MKPIPHPEPQQTFFCLAFPAPELKSKALEEKKISDFVDPDTGKQYQAQLEDMLWYPEDMLSNFVCKLLLQKPAKEVRADMMRRFRLDHGDEIAIVQFKKL